MQVSVLQALMDIAEILEEYGVYIKSDQCGVYMSIGTGRDRVRIPGDKLTPENILEFLKGYEDGSDSL